MAIKFRPVVPQAFYIAYLKVRFGTAIPNHAEIIERIMLGKYVQYLKSQQRPETFPTENLSFDSLQVNQS